MKRKGTDFHNRFIPSDYARRLIDSHGLKKAESLTRKGAEKFGKDQAGWWTAAYDTTQTIKHGGQYARANPRLKKSVRKKIQSARKFAKKSFRTIRIGKSGKTRRIVCQKGKWKQSRCKIGTTSKRSKYVGIARRVAANRPRKKSRR